MSRHFDVTVTQEDGWWVGQVEGLLGGATETRSLGALRGEVIDLIGGLLDLDEGDIDVNLNFGDAVPAAAASLAAYRAAQQSLATARSAYEDAQRAVAVQLRDQGVSVRDAAELLGLSFQRVSQITRHANGPLPAEGGPQGAL